MHLKVSDDMDDGSVGWVFIVRCSMTIDIVIRVIVDNTFFFFLFLRINPLPYLISLWRNGFNFEISRNDEKGIFKIALVSLEWKRNTWNGVREGIYRQDEGKISIIYGYFCRGYFRWNIVKDRNGWSRLYCRFSIKFFYSFSFQLIADNASR